MSTKARILEVSLRLFNSEGLNQVGVRQIAKALGMSPGNLSYHFPRKEDLIFELIGQLSALNDQAYRDYFAGEPSLSRYLRTMQVVFNNQYNYRGLVLAGQRDVQNYLALVGYDYRNTELKRLQTLREILQNLIHNRQLDQERTDLDFLINFLSLFARFWIQESLLSQRFTDARTTIHHYLKLLVKQFSLFATPSGIKEVDHFLSSLN